jgi:tetratricopeptide (TPR) repeat protein
MPVKTLTLANLYEAQGHKEDALKIYKNILKAEPNNSEARVAVRRLKGKRKSFSGVNTQMLDFFVAMDSDAEYAEFERWLLFEK